jgi:uncharacterized protein (DUF736 family)
MKMAYDKGTFDNNNRGSIFINDRKEQDNHPDFRGSLDVEGVDYWLSAWKKTSKDGKKFLSISIKRKEERQSDQPTRKAPEKKIETDDLSW